MQETQVSATQALINAAAMITAPQEPFKVGDVVVWKSKAIKDRVYPAVGQPAVVTQVRALGDGKEHEPGSTYYVQSLDFAAAIIDEDGDFLEFAQESRRFRLATPEEIAAWDETQAATI